MKLRSWHWEAVFLPLQPAEHHKLMLLIAESLRRLSKTQQLRRLRLDFQPDDSSSLTATLPGALGFELELQDGWITYQHDVEEPSALVEHLDGIATLIVNTLTAGKWFAESALQTRIGYTFEFGRLGRGTRDSRRSLNALSRQLAPGVRTLGEELIGRKTDLIGLELTGGYKTALRKRDVELWFNLNCLPHDPNTVRGAVFVQTPFDQRPRDPWMSDVVDIHDELFPRVERLVRLLHEGLNET